MENRFNLVDEPWIPVADHGRVSLRQVFANPDYRSLGGNPVQKIALMKLLLAIAQAAATPEDESEWKSLGSQLLAERCQAYLDKWHDRFYLYGNRPFLQMPAIVTAKVQSCGAVLPEVSTGNTTVLSQIQIQRQLDDAEKALLIVCLMGFALGGKADNGVVLSLNYAGKRNSKGNASVSKPGPAIGVQGFLHIFLLGKKLQESLWLNLLTKYQIAKIGMFPLGLGTAPWEQMPEGECCQTAQHLKKSLMGRLVPLNSFCLLADNGLHYSEGIFHSGYKEGMVDPTVAVNFVGKDHRALWVDPEKRPWRQLTSILSFVELTDHRGFESKQINTVYDRTRHVMTDFAIWAGGLKVSGGKTNKQFIAGNDDFVESLVWLHSDMLGKPWFVQLKAEMDEMDALAKNLYGRVMGFFKEQKVDGGKIAPQASRLFWQLCERNFQQLVDSCDQNEPNKLKRQQLRRQFADYVQQVYDQFCPKESARQLDAWAKCRPNNSKYLKQEA